MPISFLTYHGCPQTALNHQEFGGLEDKRAGWTLHAQKDRPPSQLAPKQKAGHLFYCGSPLPQDLKKRFYLGENMLAARWAIRAYELPIAKSESDDRGSRT